MEHTVFNEAQLDILNMMQWVKSPEALSDLKQAISDFFHKNSFIYLVVTRKSTIFVALIPGSL